MPDSSLRLSSWNAPTSQARRAATASKLDASTEEAPPRAKLLLVDFRSGEAVCQHPDVAPLLKEGWSVTGAAPRVTPEGTRLLVVLAPPGAPPSLAARRRFDAPAE